MACRRSFLLLFFFGLGCSKDVSNSPSTPRASLFTAIYDSDSRQDVLLSPPLSPIHASAMLISKDRLRKTPDGKFEFRQFKLSQAYPLCEGEKFQDQVVLGFCSGVLVAPQVLLTAGHCLRTQEDCQKTNVTFAFNFEKARQASLRQEEIYSCSQILAREDTSIRGGHDFALIRLDRPVAGIRPVLLRSSKALTPNTAIVSLSYPLGLPLKADQGRISRNEIWSNFIEAEVDTFSGSSGSGLFTTAGELVGLLSRGSEDILEDDIQRVQKEGGCLRFHRCRGECRGERYYRIDLIWDLLQNQEFNKTLQNPAL
jgi:hypothetical protein